MRTPVVALVALLGSAGMAGAQINGGPGGLPDAGWLDYSFYTSLNQSPNPAGIGGFGTPTGDWHVVLQNSVSNPAEWEIGLVQAGTGKNTPSITYTGNGVAGGVQKGDTLDLGLKRLTVSFFSSQQDYLQNGYAHELAINANTGITGNVYDASTNATIGDAANAWKASVGGNGKYEVDVANYVHPNNLLYATNVIGGSKDAEYFTQDPILHTTPPPPHDNAFSVANNAHVGYIIFDTDYYIYDATRGGYVTVTGAISNSGVPAPLTGEFTGFDNPTVPEPASLALLVPALAPLGFALRRRKKA
jgi:hypothetical protein